MVYQGIDQVFVLPELTHALLRRWYFILLTVAANAVFYFGAGCLLETLGRRLLRRFSGTDRR